MKKIMFSDDYCLTQAVLDGTKTMTRRFGIANIAAGDVPKIHSVRCTSDKAQKVFTLHNKDGEYIGKLIPRYSVGEVVAIAQCYKEIYPNADFEMIDGAFMTESAGWTNKMFVRANLMKHHIKITDVKIERLQDISCENCLREGIKEIDITHYRKRYVFGDRKIEYHIPREAFAVLIDKVSGKGTWESNLWMVAYSFELVD